MDVVTSSLQSKAQVSGKNGDFPAGFTKYVGSAIIFNRANVASLSLRKSPPLFCIIRIASNIVSPSG